MIPCAVCDGDGEMMNLGNLNPHVRIEDWLPPVACGRCGGTGWDPSEPHPSHGYVRNQPRAHLRAVEGQ